ncbi:MAG: hypothetical protein QXH30_00290 [Candidatus Bilamarchaeaceae archaeon]
MCDMKALTHILATQQSPTLRERIRAMRQAKEAFELVGMRLNSEMRNRERSGEAAALDREALKKLNKEVLDRACVYDRIREEVEKGKNLIIEEKNVFCHWLKDKESHLRDLEGGWAEFWNYCKDHENATTYDVLLDEGSCDALMDSTCKMISNLVDIETRIKHAVIASRALEVDVPSAVMEALNSNPRMFNELKDQLFSDMYAEAVLLLKKQERDEVVAELLKLLYPENWKELAIQTDPAALEKSMERAEARRWKEELKKKHPSVYLTMKDIMIMRELSFGNMETAERFVELIEKGVHPADALFLLFSKAGEKQREFHLYADVGLSAEGLNHSDIFHAFRRLKEKDCQKLVENLTAYARWMRAFPQEMPDAERQMLSAILAINVDMPEKQADAFIVALDKLPHLLKEVDSNCPECMNAFVAFLHISLHKSKKRDETPLWAKMPHESINFDNDMNYYIGRDEVSAEDVRLAIAYALKGAHGNARQGGRYVPTTAFRNMLKKVLPRNDVKDVLPFEKRDPAIRASEVELLLANHGVIVYKRNGQLIGLNMDESGKLRSESRVTERGREILRLAREWMLERDKIVRESQIAEAERNNSPSEMPESVEVLGGRGTLFWRVKAAIDASFRNSVERFISEASVEEIAKILRNGWPAEEIERRLKGLEELLLKPAE